MELKGSLIRATTAIFLNLMWQMSRNKYVAAQVRLLEVKQYELESSEHGTGTLDADLRVLQSIEEEQRGTTAMPHSGPTACQLAALRHRMEQKRLVRDYLGVYGAALEEEMAHMKGLVDTH